MKNKLMLQKLSDANSYKKIKLETLGKFFKGNGIPRDSAQSGDLPAIRYGELYTDYDTFISGNTRSRISQEIANDAFELRFGDILFAGSGETAEDIGKSAVFLGRDGYAGGDIIVFRPEISVVSPKFLAVYFETEAWKKQRRRVAQGQSIVHIHTYDLKKMTIKLPGIVNQQKIVQILEIYDAIIEKLKNKIYFEVRKLQWLFSQLICSGDSKLEKLCNLAEIMTGKKDVNQGCLNGRYPFFTCAKQHIWSEEYSFDGEAICIAGNGEIGKTAYYDGKFEAYQRTYVLMDFKISGRYLYYIIDNLFKRMVEQQKQMSAMPYIKLETLREFKVPVYSDADTQKIVRILDTQTEYILYHEKYISELSKMRRYLLGHLITGDFDLSNIRLEKEE